MENLDLSAHHNREQSNLVFVYIGGRSCGFCGDPDYKRLLREAIAGLSAIATGRRQPLRTIGVSNDWDVSEGVAFLSEIHPWDEIVVGNNWHNSAIMEHVWEIAPDKGAVPQMLVFQRTFKFPPGRITPLGKRYVLRLIGKGELERWLGSGFPLDPLPDRLDIDP